MIKAPEALQEPDKRHGGHIVYIVVYRFVVSSNVGLWLLGTVLHGNRDRMDGGGWYSHVMRVMRRVSTTFLSTSRTATCGAAVSTGQGR